MRPFFWIVGLLVAVSLYAIEPFSVRRSEILVLEGLVLVDNELIDRAGSYKQIQVLNSDFDPARLVDDAGVPAVSLVNCTIPTLHLSVHNAIKYLQIENVVAKDGSGFLLQNKADKSIPDLRLGLWGTKIDSISNVADLCEEYDIDISMDSADIADIIPLLKELYGMGRTNPNFSFRFVNGAGYPNSSDEGGLFYTKKPGWWDGVDIAGTETLKVVDNRVRLRDNPGLNSRVIGYVNKGNRLLKKNSGDGVLVGDILWFAVYSYDLKKEGFISSEYVETMNGLYFP